MELSTAQRLAALNRQFYEEHGENFADARPRLAAGVRCVLARIGPGARVLEIGCGDGKVARALPGVHYVGVDQSAALLARARRLTDEAQPASPAPVFIQANVLAPGWEAALPPGRYDWVLAFAVFHHLPGREARARLYRTLAARLAPGGRLAMSNWQFTRSPRLMRRRLPWQAAGLTDADVEDGDYLLSWERKGQRGQRYVHHLDEAEARALAAGAGLRVAEVFHADGVSGNLTEYVIAEHAAGE